MMILTCSSQVVKLWVRILDQDTFFFFPLQSVLHDCELNDNLYI